MSAGDDGASSAGMTFRLATLIVLLGLAACGLPGAQESADAGSPTAEPTRGTDAQVQTPDEALSADAAQMAASLKLPQAEAERRLRAQAVLGDHLARLREVHRDRLAGIYLQQAPDFRAVVRLKGDAPPRPHPLNASPVPGVPIEFRTGAAHTLDELHAARDAHAEDIVRIPGLQGYGTDERTGALALSVYAPGREAEVRRAVAKLQAHMGVPLHIEFVSAPVTLE